jgi:hypothetical protein
LVDVDLSFASLKSSWWELNPRPRPYQGRALPLSYMSEVFAHFGAWTVHPYESHSVPQEGRDQTPQEAGRLLTKPAILSKKK